MKELRVLVGSPNLMGRKNFSPPSGQPSNSTARSKVDYFEHVLPMKQAEEDLRLREQRQHGEAQASREIASLSEQIEEQENLRLAAEAKQRELAQRQARLAHLEQQRQAARKHERRLNECEIHLRSYVRSGRGDVETMQQHLNVAFDLGADPDLIESANELMSTLKARQADRAADRKALEAQKQAKDDARKEQLRLEEEERKEEEDFFRLLNELVEQPEAESQNSVSLQGAQSQQGMLSGMSQQSAQLLQGLIRGDSTSCEKGCLVSCCSATQRMDQASSMSVPGAGALPSHSKRNPSNDLAAARRTLFEGINKSEQNTDIDKSKQLTTKMAQAQGSTIVDECSNMHSSEPQSTSASFNPPPSLTDLDLTREQRREVNKLRGNETDYDAVKAKLKEKRKQLHEELDWKVQMQSKR